MKIRQTFEEYMQEKHLAQYEGFDDDIPDDFEKWLWDTDPETWLILGQAYAKEQISETIHQEKAMEQKDNLSKGL